MSTEASLPRGIESDRPRVCLTSVLAQGSSVIVIPAGRKVEHIRDSQGAADLKLSAEDLAAIDAAEFSIS